MSTSIKFALKTYIWYWLKFCAKCRRLLRWNRRCAQPSLVLIPCEPGHVIGSRGDEAMVYAVLTDFRRRHPDGKIVVVVSHADFAATDDGCRLTHDFPGIVYEASWVGHLSQFRIYNSILRHRATEFYALGADCMDGYYTSDVSFMLLSCSDIAFNLGIATKLTGFSFNAHPTPECVRMFDSVSRGFICNVRDPVSLERVQTMCSRWLEVRLVADVAFALQPVVSEQVKRVGAWIDGERARGQTILAFNLHGMLVPRDRYNALVSEVTAGLDRFLAAHESVSVVLVPHDYRPQGDIDALTKIAAGIASPRLRLADEVLSAAELKGLMGLVDGLFTSRMHLGIAALGQGKPIGAFAYQGKFAGLFRHFGLSEDMVLDPAEMSRLPDVLTLFVGNLSEFARRVVEKLPVVRALSSLNLNSGVL